MSYKPDLIPIGSILAWTGGYFTATGNGGTYTNVLGNTVAAANQYLNPKGYKVCDGTAINDSQSPIFNGAGRYLPDLTDSRFLQGSNAVGGKAASNTNTQTTSFSSSTIQATGWSGYFNKQDLGADQIAHYHTSGNTEARIRIYNGGATLHDRISDPSLIGNWTSNAATSVATAGAGGTSIGSGTQTQGYTGSNGISWNVANLYITLASNPSFNANSLNASMQSWDNRPQWLNVLYILKIK